MRRMRVLHAIHDFLPRHAAGSEIYAFELARELATRHDVSIVAGEYDPATPHGTLRWRVVDALPVVELVNNWEFERVDESYTSPRINRQLGHVLDATRPDVLHVHSLLNLSFDLPRLARERGICSVATLHDYTLVCASGGQRVHVAESHVCRQIDPSRCSRCFAESPFHARIAAGRLTRRKGGRLLARTAASVRRRAPAAFAGAAARLPGPTVSTADMHRRLAYARHVFEQVDLWVAPSADLAKEFVQLGLDPDRITVADYGFVPGTPAPRPRRETVVFGFVGTLVWHKGVHVLLEALGALRGRFDVLLYGNPDVHPAYAADLRRQAAGLPVRFMGAFDRARLADVYASFDVLVVPSLWPENSPLVIHEAHMHGAAVVAARVGGIPDLVSDGVNGCVYDAYAVDDLRRTLQRFVDDPRLAARLGAAAPPVKTITADAREWEARYERLLGAPRPEPVT